MKKFFHSFEDLFSFYLPGIIIVILMILMCTEICLRWLFKTSMMGIVEIVESALIVITFASLAGIQRQKGHVRMNLLIDKLAEKKIGRIIETFNPIFITVITGILIYPFIQTIVRFRQFNETTEYIEIPIWLIAIVMPLGIIILCIRLIVQAVTEARKIRKYEADVEPNKD